MLEYQGCSQSLAISFEVWYKDINKGIDGSARKPASVQDTEYMVEKTHHLAPHLAAFGPI